jgi:hypothetical protein
MFEELTLQLEFIFKEVPNLPHQIAMILHGLEGADKYGLFQIIWAAFNIFILIRIFQPSLNNPDEPSRLVYCISAFVVWAGWMSTHFVSSQVSLFPFQQEMPTLLLVTKLFTVYVNFLLLLKISVLIARIYQIVFRMHRAESVIHLIFKDVNLKLILTTKTTMRYLVIYMVVNAINQYLSPFEKIMIDTFFIWGFATIPLLIFCFFIAKEALHRRHQSVFIEIVADQEYQSSDQGLEETLSLVASKRMGTDLIVNEIFMGQIFRLVIAALVTYSVNHFLV